MQDFLNAARKLTRGIFKIPLFWVLYIQLLILLHGIVPFLFLPRTTAVVVLVCFYAGALTMVWLTMKFGFTRILGAAHVWWLPMFGYLAATFDRSVIDTTYGKWVLLLLIIQPITLALDAMDITRWMLGDSAEMAPDL